MDNQEVKRHVQSRIRVEVLAGPDRGVVRTLNCAKCTLGTSLHNDVVLADPTISPYHLEILCGEGVRIADLGSENGTFLDEVQIRRAIVPLGTRLRLGETAVLLLKGEPGNVTPPLPVPEVPGLVTFSPVMQDVARAVEQLAHLNAPVLMEGELGTGKELIARAIHEASPRANAPFIVVAADALAPTVVTAHIFGDGPQGGAERRQEGAFDQAQGGSIYFDEVGELPLSAQRALLNALEDQTLSDSSSGACSGVRVFAATRRDLRAEANQGYFLLDLYVRLAANRIGVPPLRERPDDLEELVGQLAREITGVPESPFSDSALELLRVRWWSGNVRELRDVVESALQLRNVAPDSVRSGTYDLGPVMPYRRARGEAIAAFERNYLSQLIEAWGGNASGAARAAGMDRPYLLSLLRKHGLR